MIEGLLALSLFVAAQGSAQAAVTVDKDSVPAQGEQQVVVRVPKSGMVHLAVDSDVGVMCTLIDHQRGPFFSDGVVGKRSCNADVLLDAGLYKLLLTAPGERPNKKQKQVPQAKVRVVAFADVDAAAVLTPGRSSVVTLPVGKQVTRWLRVKGRQEIVVDVYGRTAGQVRLWRDGLWLDDIAATHEVERLVEGRPLHHTRVQAVVDAGDYALVVYGSDAVAFSVGNDDDTAVVAYDAAPASSSRSEVFTLPLWGHFTVRAPGKGLAAWLSVEGTRSQAVELTTESVAGDGLAQRRRSGRCTVSADQVVASCLAMVGESNQAAAVLDVKGPPGTRGRILWLPTVGGQNDHSLIDARSDAVIDVGVGAAGISVVGLPGSVDAAPLGCMLDRLDDKGRFLGTVERDLSPVGLTQAWRRRFNTDGTTTAVWLTIEKPGVYSITADKNLGASCEVFRLDATGTDKQRVSEGKDGACDAKVPLPAGPIEVRLYGGKPGIEDLRIGATGLAALVGTNAETPMRSACLFQPTDGVTPGRYRVRTSGAAGATMHLVGALPRGMAGAAAEVVGVDPGRVVRLTVATDVALQVKQAGAGLRCALDGVALPSCETTASTTAATATLTLTNESARPLLAWIGRVPPPPALSALSPWAGTPPRLPVVNLGSTQWFDLSGDADRSFLVDVATAGLYSIQTEGLLRTRCVVRTAVSAKLFSGDQNGRGRNCLVQSYLKPGRYLVTVSALGSSRGRAGLSLTQQVAWAGGELTLGDERFVSVDASVLARHGFTVKKAGPVAWSVTAQSGALSCRLDDNDGWPIKAVPHECGGTDTLQPGTYTVSVLPLTVESKRALRLGEPPVAEVFAGDKSHRLTLNTVHNAELGNDGKDTFTFAVTAAVDVGIRLTGGMQGRVIAVDDKGARGDVVGVIAPVGGVGFGLGGGGGDSGEDGGYSDDGEYNDGGEYNEDGGGEYNGDGEYDHDYSGDGEYGENPDYESEGEGIGTRAMRSTRPVDDGRSAARMLSATVHQPLPPLSGTVVSLPAGSYVLETEHSRGDVGVSYQVSVSSNTLMPGSVVRTQAPAVVDVVGPLSAAGGLVRIKSRGPTDVACRLVDPAGALVAQSNGSGADWNCALAVPLVAGTTYKLFVDAEVLQVGPTEVKAEFLEAKDTGTLKDGDAFKLVGKVARASLTPPAAAVQDVTFTSSDAFSCAAFDVDGRLLDRHVDTKSCTLLLWSNGDVRPFSLLVWTADRPASVKVSLRERSLAGAGLFSTELGDDAVRAAVAQARGRYETAPGARCLAKSSRGALTACDDAVTVDPAKDGDTVLVGFARGSRGPLTLREQKANLDTPTTSPRRLSGRHTVERQATSKPALHLVDLRALPGSAARPACRVEGGVGGVGQESDARCVAASGLTTESVLVSHTRPGVTLAVTLAQTSVVPPAPQALSAGTFSVPRVGRYRLPGEAWRLDLATPHGAWVVQLDDSDRAVDLCAPSAPEQRKSGLARCTLRGRGGSVVVAGVDGAIDGAFDVRADVVRFDVSDDPPRSLTSLLELRPRAAGRERLRFAASTVARVLRVEGAGARACAVLTDDGGRIAACTATIPAGLGGEVVVEQDGRGLRAMLAPQARPADLYAARFGSVPSLTGSALVLGKQSPLAPQASSPTYAARTVAVPSRGLLRVRATSGVCAVVDKGGRVLKSEGLGSGCDLDVDVDADVSVVVRGFAGAAVGGAVTATFAPVTSLLEGVNPAVLVNPGETRVFALELMSDGELGVGIQVDAEVLTCTLENAQREVVGEGCQLFGRFDKGRYLLRVKAPTDTAPRRFAPVVFGLAGAAIDVPDDYLRDFFLRVPRPASASTASEVR
jgi:hypothetical protein